MVKLINKKFKTPKSRSKAINKLCNQLRHIKNDLLNSDKPKTSSTIYHHCIDKERKNILPNRKYKKIMCITTYFAHHKIIYLLCFI